MDTKILAICVVGLLATVGLGALAAQPLTPISGTQVLSRGNVAVHAIGVDEVGYKIYTGTGMGTELVGVKLSFTADIPSGTVIFVSVRDSGDTELGYDAQITAAAILETTLTTFDLWNLADEDWAAGGPYSTNFPFLPNVDYLIVTVAGNSHYVHVAGA